MFDAVVEDCLFELPPIIRGKRLAVSEPYRRVATVIDGDPRESKGDIFAIGGNEYYVPGEKSRDRDGNLSALTVRLDRAERIVERPNGTRQLGEMRLSQKIPSSDLPLLEQAVREWNPAHFGYAVNIVSPQP